jgi:hypothetical protein
MQRYYHPSHLFDSFQRARKTTRTIQSEADIKGFAKLKPADQERLRKLIYRSASHKKMSTEYRVVMEEVTSSSEDSCSEDFDSAKGSSEDSSSESSSEASDIEDEEFTGIQAEYDSWTDFDAGNEFRTCYIMLSGTGWCAPCATEHKKFSKTPTNVPKVVINLPETGLNWSAHGLVVKSVPKFIFKEKTRFKALGSHWTAP